MLVSKLDSLGSVIIPYARALSLRKSLHRFTSKVELAVPKGSFTVRTVSGWKELEQVLKLRHQVFHAGDFGKKAPFRNGCGPV